MNNGQLTTDNQQPITPAQVNILTQRTPTDVVKTRKGRGGKILSYVSHDWVTRQLNEAFNWQWSFEILSERILPDEAAPREIVVKGRLTIHTPGGNIIKNQFGSAEVKRTKNGDIISLGDDFKAASSDALKKCASLLGLALDLYGDSSPPPLRRQGQSNGVSRADYVNRIQELIGEIEFHGGSITLEPGFLERATIPQLTEYGKRLNAQVEGMRKEANGA